MSGRRRELSRERVQQLALPIMTVLRDNYLEGTPPSRERVLENLNALAFCVAATIVGTGDRRARQEARGFFDDALRDNIAELLRGSLSPGDPL